MTAAAADTVLVAGIGNLFLTDDGFGSDDSVLTGWTVGAGAEYAVTNNVTVRAEYNYTDLGKDTLTTPTAAASIGYQGSDVKLGVNYKF